MYKTAVEKLLAEGLAQLESSGMLAKAAQGGKNPLDNDFSEFDKARNSSDAHEDDEDDDETEGGEGDDDEDQDGSGDDSDDSGSDDSDDDDSDSDDSDDDDSEDDDSDDDSDDADPAQPKPGGVVAKAVDAMPLLQAIEERLTEIVSHNEALRGENAALRKQVRTIAKAVSGLSDGTLMIAKAVSGRMDAPLPPKHLRQQVSVPTAKTIKGGSGFTAEQAFAKAEQAVEDGRLSTFDMSLLNGMVNQHGIEGALAQMPQVYAVLKGGN